MEGGGQQLSDVAATFLDLLTRADRERATDLLLSMCDDGASPVDIISDVLVPAQTVVGEHWQSGTWTVADEHAASAVVSAALAALSHHVRARHRPDGPGRPVVVLGCVHGEWHALPAQMAAEVMAFSGVSVDFVGASTPPSDLGAYLVEREATACALSCSTWSALVGARRTIDAAHDVGVPVVVGGRAWGATPQRARALGADGWAPGAAEAAELVTAWSESPPTLAQADEWPMEALLLESPETGIVNGALDELFIAYPQLAGLSNGDIGMVRDAALDLLRHAGAALVADDPLLFLEFTDWLVQFGAARGIDRHLVGLVLGATHDAVEDSHPAAALLLQAAAKEFDI